MVSSDLANIKEINRIDSHTHRLPDRSGEFDVVGREGDEREIREGHRERERKRECVT